MCRSGNKQRIEEQAAGQAYVLSTTNTYPSIAIGGGPRVMKETTNAKDRVLQPCAVQLGVGPSVLCGRAMEGRSEMGQSCTCENLSRSEALAV